MGYSGEHIVLERSRERLWLNSGELMKEVVYQDLSSYWQLVLVSSKEGVQATISCRARKDRLWGPHLFHLEDEAVREGLEFIETQAAKAEELGRQFGAPEARYLP